MIKSLVNSVAHKYAASAAGHAESIAPTDTPPLARKENVTQLPHPTLPREKGNMEKGNVNTSEIKLVTREVPDMSGICNWAFVLASVLLLVGLLTLAL